MALKEVEQCWESKHRPTCPCKLGSSQLLPVQGRSLRPRSQVVGQERRNWKYVCCDQFYQLLYAISPTHFDVEDYPGVVTKEAARQILCEQRWCCRSDARI